MATNIDTTLNQAPLGYDPANAQPAAELPSEPSIEVLLPDGEEPDETTLLLDDSAMAEAALIAEALSGGGSEAAQFDANLAETLPESVLARLATDLLDETRRDLASRSDWERAYVEGLKLLGLKYEERSEPWAGACGATHPLLTEAIVRFQSETVTETFPARGPVRTKIVGKETPDKREAAARVEEDMNYQLTERMLEFRPEHEKMLWSLPAAGSAFKKVYYDPSMGRQMSLFIPAEDIILPYGTTDIQTCFRVTHRMRKTRNEIRKLQASGFYRVVDLGDPVPHNDDIRDAKDEETGFSEMDPDYFTLYEVHVDVSLSAYATGRARGTTDTTTGEEEAAESGSLVDEIALPYVVTVLDGTSTVLSVRRNWAENDPLKLKRQHFVHYQYIPGFGAYGFGLFHLLGGFAKSATSLLRQLVDAGTLANLPGGLKSRGLRIKGDDTPIAPGEFRDVDVASGAIRDNILPLPYKEPSATLAALLGTIVEEGRRFAATADMKVSDMSAQAPVGTTLALIERQLKVLTAVQARVHYSLKQELRLLAGIIRDYAEDSYDHVPATGRPQARREDYEYTDIFPVSDPNAATMSQRVVQFQAAVQMAQMAPDIYDLPQLHRSMLETLGLKNADKLVPLEEDLKPSDPVTENMQVLKGKPLKAFRHQDHEAHIRVHMAAMQDPIIMQMVGQNPRAPQIQAALTAHIADHVGHAYRAKIEQQLGMPLPPDDEPMDPQVEIALSGLMAQAAQQVLQQSQQMAQQQKNQQQAQDPVLQLQQKELSLKERDLVRKEREMVLEHAGKADALALEAAKVIGDQQIRGTQIGAKIAADRANLGATTEQAGTRIGVELAKLREESNRAMQDRLDQPTGGEVPPTSPVEGA